MTTFNPLDQSANVDLSSDLLSVTVTSNASGGVRGTTSKAAGKFYVEYVWDVVAGANLAASGFLSGAGDLEDAVGGTTNNPIVRETGTIRLNGVNAGFIGAAPAAGDTIGAAIDFDNGKVWFRRNGGNWNNSGSDNPATNTGGLDISAMPALYPYAGMDRTGIQITGNFGATAFNFAAPSGFSAWDVTADVNLSADFADDVGFNAVLDLPALNLVADFTDEGRIFAAMFSNQRLLVADLADADGFAAALAPQLPLPVQCVVICV